MKYDAVMPHNWLVIVAKLLPGYAAHLKDIHEIGFISQLDIELELVEIEILKRKVVEERLRGEQLLTADMHRVLGNFIGLAHGAFAGGELNLRGKSLLSAGRKHHGAISVNAQFQTAEKTRVVVEETNVGGARRHDVTGNSG